MEVLFFGILAFSAIIAITRNMAGNDDPRYNTPHNYNETPTLYNGDSNQPHIHIHNGYPPQMPYGQPYGQPYGPYGQPGPYDPYGRGPQRPMGWGNLLAIVAVAIGVFAFVIQPGNGKYYIDPTNPKPKTDTVIIYQPGQPRQESISKIFDSPSVNSESSLAGSRETSIVEDIVVLGEYPSEHAAEEAAQVIYGIPEMTGYDLHTNSKIHPGSWLLILRCKTEQEAQEMIQFLNTYREKLKPFCPKVPYTIG